MRPSARLYGVSLGSGCRRRLRPPTWVEPEMSMRYTNQAAGSTSGPLILLLPAVESVATLRGGPASGEGRSAYSRAIAASAMVPAGHQESTLRSGMLAPPDRLVGLVGESSAWSLHLPGKSSSAGKLHHAVANGRPGPDHQLPEHGAEAYHPIEYRKQGSRQPQQESTQRDDGTLQVHPCQTEQMQRVDQLGIGPGAEDQEDAGVEQTEEQIDRGP